MVEFVNGLDGSEDFIDDEVSVDGTSNVDGKAAGALVFILIIAVESVVELDVVVVAESVVSVMQ